MAVGINFVILLALVLGPFLYQRITLVLSLQDNAPGKIHSRSSFSSYQVKFADQLRNCEDVILPEGLDGLALLSCDEGRDRWNTVMGIFASPQTQGSLYIYNYTSPASLPQQIHFLDFPSATTDFHPLGIEYHHPSRTLYVINHAAAGSRLELFRFAPSTHTATHLKTLMHPQIHSPNSIAVLDETTLYITNDHYFLARYHPWLAKLETWLAPPSGNVIHFDILTETATHLDRVAFANGVVLLDDKTLAVASTTKAEVYVYHAPNNGVSRGSDIKPKLYLKKTIPIPFLPDNLSFNTHTGKLLIAGHAHPFSMDPFAKSRDACHSGKGETQKKACQIRTSTGVAEWSEEAGLKVLWMGDEFATGSTAVRDGKRGMGIVSGLFERGLLVWRE